METDNIFIGQWHIFTYIQHMDDVKLLYDTNKHGCFVRFVIIANLNNILEYFHAYKLAQRVLKLYVKWMFRSPIGHINISTIFASQQKMYDKQQFYKWHMVFPEYDWMLLVGRLLSLRRTFSCGLNSITTPARIQNNIQSAGKQCLEIYNSWNIRQ